MDYSQSESYDYDYDVPNCPHQCVENRFCNFELNSGPPNLCGWDSDTGEDLFCCKDVRPEANSEVISQQFGNFDCLDFHEHCAKILQLNPTSCDGDFASNKFMRVACMKTCNRCTNLGCRDEFEECKEWSKQGLCSVFAPFMVYNCRESCGSCGLRSGKAETHISS